MLPNALLLLGLGVGSAFALPSNVQETARADEQGLPSSEDVVALGALSRERLFLAMDLRARLAEQREIARTIGAEIQLKKHSRKYAYRKRLEALEESVAEAPAKLKAAVALADEAKRDLSEAKRKGYSDTHSEIQSAKRKLSKASNELIFYRAVLEENTEALAQEAKLTPAEREARFEPEFAEMREKVRVALAEAQSLDEMLLLMEKSVATEHKIFEIFKNNRTMIEEAKASSDAMFDEAMGRATEKGRSSHTIVQDDYLTARATSAALARPLLVNFTAHTAVNARMMEVRVFQESEVASLLAKFVEARLHTDAADDARRKGINDRMADVAKTSAVPFYAVLDPRTGEELGRLHGAASSPAKFAEFLSAAAERFDRPTEPATDTELWRRIFRLEDKVRSFSAAKEAAVPAATTPARR